MNLVKKIIFPSLLIQVLYILLTIIIAPGAKTNLIVALLFLLIIIPQIFYIFSSNFKVIAINFFWIGISIIVIELLFFFKIITNQNINSITLSNFKQRQDIQFFDTQPYIKFAPNINITSIGARGNDFTYSWKTDELGFKNKFTNLKDKKFDFIALGDSFTEGMGVSIKNTWPNIVSENSEYTIYNAGVQGYAVSQMFATLKLLEKDISFDGVILGTLTGLFTRERIFSENNLALKQGGRGGIKSIYDLGLPSTNTFLVEFARQLKNSIKYLIESKNSKSELKTFYIQEFIDSNNYSRESLIKDKYWKLHLKYITNIIERAKAKDKRVIIIQYPLRPYVYLSAEELGLKNILESQYYYELDYLKETLPSYVEIIDLLPLLKLHHLKNPEKPIYFQKDGHLNEVGNNLVAKIVMDYLRSN